MVDYHGALADHVLDLWESASPLGPFFWWPQHADWYDQTAVVARDVRHSHLRSDRLSLLSLWQIPSTMDPQADEFSRKRWEPPLVYIIGFGKLAEALSGYLTPADLHQLQAVHWWIASDLRWYVLGPPTPAIMVQTRGS